MTLKQAKKRQVKILEEYKNGADVRELSVKYDLSTAYIYSLIKRSKESEVNII